MEKKESNTVIKNWMCGQNFISFNKEKNSMYTSISHTIS